MSHVTGAALEHVHVDPTELDEACDRFASLLERLDRDLRRRAATIPTETELEEAKREFWQLNESFRRRPPSTAPTDQRLKARVRERLGKWLWRSRHLSRSYFKPHGYAGDYVMIEWMYDLERTRGLAAHQPGIVNVLDHVFSTIHSVEALWHRRRWFAALLEREHRRRGGCLRVLDIACGGGRYLRDFMEQCEGKGVSIVALDQDSSAVSFVRSVSLEPWSDRGDARCIPVKRLRELPFGSEFDVVISAGLFDYLDDTTASSMLSTIRGWLRPDGVIAVSDFHPDDASGVTKDWLADWPLIFRTEQYVARLFPVDMDVRTEVSPNGALTYGLARSPDRGHPVE